MIRFVVDHSSMMSNTVSRIKFFFFTSLMCLGLLAGVTSCNDDNVIGGSLQPVQDGIDIYYDTICVFSETVQVDSVLYRSASAYLGEFTDPTFGTTNCDFLAQIYCPYDYAFPDDVKRIDSSYLYLYYTEWFGDSTAIMHVNVYELNQKLTVGQSYYTNLDAEDYCDKSKLLGHVSFTTGDMYSTDSMRELDTYTTVIKVPIDLSLGNRFLKDSRDSSLAEYFTSPKKFREYFNGIYVSCDFGNGSIAYITHSELEFCYGTTLESTTMEGLRDSFVIGASYFPVTKEVKQVSRISHPDLDKYLNPYDAKDSLDYIFSPAGLFTRVVIPSSVFDTLGGKSVNAMNLKVNATQLDEWTYGMEPPSYMLLIRESDAYDFFSRFEMNDGLYSFLAEYDSDEEYYDFDLSYYAQKMVREQADSTATDFEPFTSMLMIPVTVVESEDEDEVRLEQLLTPSAVKVRAWNHPYQPMKLELVYSNGKLN